MVILETGPLWFTGVWNEVKFDLTGKLEIVSDDESVSDNACTCRLTPVGTGLTQAPLGIDNSGIECLRLPSLPLCWGVPDNCASGTGAGRIESLPGSTLLVLGGLAVDIVVFGVECELVVGVLRDGNVRVGTLSL